MKNVKNLNGTSDNTCRCGSWIKHWRNFSGQSRTRCVVDQCSNSVSVGGHVQKNSVVDDAWYIIPICKACNNKKGESLRIDGDVKLVPANVSKTCGK